MSNYGGELTAEECAGLIADGVQHVIVRIDVADPGRQAIMRQQLAACRAAGIPYSGYVFPDYVADPAQFMLRVFGAAGCLRSLWIDVEPAERMPLPPFSVIERWVRTAKSACPPEMLFGIYTARWVVDGMPDWGDLSDLPLWFASYGGSITLDVDWGGWTRAAGIQYVGTTELAGQSVDLSLFAPGVLA